MACGFILFILPFFCWFDILKCWWAMASKKKMRILFRRTRITTTSFEPKLTHFSFCNSFKIVYGISKNWPATARANKNMNLNGVFSLEIIVQVYKIRKIWIKKFDSGFLMNIINSIFNYHAVVCATDHHSMIMIIIMYNFILYGS